MNIGKTSYKNILYQKLDIDIEHNKQLGDLSYRELHPSLLGPARNNLAGIFFDDVTVHYSLEAISGLLAIYTAPVFMSQIGCVCEVLFSICKWHSFSMSQMLRGCVCHSTTSEFMSSII